MPILRALALPLACFALACDHLTTAPLPPDFGRALGGRAAIGTASPRSHRSDSITSTVVVSDVSVGIISCTLAGKGPNIDVGEPPSEFRASRVLRIDHPPRSCGDRGPLFVLDGVPIDNDDATRVAAGVNVTNIGSVELFDACVVLVSHRR